MGTRVNVELGEREAPALILFANSSHPQVDPVAVVKDVVKGCGRYQITEVAERLLALRYPSTKGNNRAGDRIWTLDLEPGDRETLVHVLPDLSIEVETGLDSLDSCAEAARV